MHRSLARWLVVGALAAFGFFAWSNVAFAQDGGADIQGQNSADDGTAATGSATGSNTNGFNAGPNATAGGQASSQQLGDNSATVNQSGSGKSGDPVAGGQVTGSVGDARVQNQNSASGNTAVSGDASVINDAEVNLGPSAVSDTDEAQAAQSGNNRLRVGQAVAVETGDAVAGSQITGIADADFALVQNQNSAEDNVALSGEAFALNLLTAAAGPVAETSGPLAQASQVGDNDAVIEQASAAESGDGVAGSQVTGIVGGSDFTVQNQNSSEDNVGLSGDALALSIGFATLGPAALSIDPTGTSAEAQAGQTGDNQLVADQASGAKSGDALGGAQVTGLVSEEEGILEVQNQQSSDTDTAISGEAESLTILVANAGPVADADSALVVEDGGDFVVFGGEAQAQASQIGDNEVDVAQASAAESGDAVAGGQVTGSVGGSDITIQNQNAAEDAVAVSGDATSDNVALVNAGPLANADASALLVLEDEIEGAVFVCVGAECPAVAVVDLELNVFLVGGDAEAQASQTGDNSAIVEQAVAAESGDAVAGGQVTGVVSEGSDVTVQNQNASEDSLAVSGESDATNTGVVTAGPIANADASAAIVVEDNLAAAVAVCVGNGCVAVAVADLELNALLIGGEAEAQASQTGDNLVAVEQAVAAESGDAVAGGQVTGIVAGDGSNITVQNQNASEDDVALSGNADAVNTAVVVAGPDAFADASAATVFVDNAAVATAVCVGDSCTAVGVAIVEINGLTIGGTAEAQAAQTGDNAVLVEQAVAAESGDAVAGAQVTGVVAGDGSEITVQNQNAAEAPFALSGDATVAATTIVTGGPVADADASAATISVSNFAQANAVCVGAECVANGVSFVIPSLFTFGGEAEAQASQIGDNAVAVEQAVAVATGDAVAGAQVTGAVAGDGSEITIQNQNAADEAVALSGNASAVNDVLVAAGPVGLADASAAAVSAADFAQANAACIGATCIAIGVADVSAELASFGGDALAQASQTGDNEIAVDQDVSVSTGDAVAGAQVTGAVAGDGSDITVQNQNNADDALALSGTGTLVNVVAVEAGPDAIAEADAAAGAAFDIAEANAVCIGADCVAIGIAGVGLQAAAFGGDAEAQASQNGDNEIAVAQSVSADTGDAVAGAQVTGTVAGDGSTTTIQNQNVGDGAVALTGVVEAVNVTDVNAGPEALASATGNVFAEDNFAEANPVCIGVDCTAIAAATVDIDAVAVGGETEAQSSQVGDNLLAVEQDIAVSSGDAVAGSQVTGAVSGDNSETTIQNQNSADDEPVAISGTVVAVNTLSAVAGPDALADSTAEFEADDNVASANAGCVGAECNALAIADVAVEATVIGGEADAQAAQTGDNGVAVDQALAAESGDAVAGSQVTGAVGGTGSDATIQNQNTSEAPLALSGDVVALNDAEVQAGPDAEADASVFVESDNLASAVAGCLGVACVAVANASATFSGEFFGGDAAVQASQTGDNDADVSQSVAAASGDAVAGSQIAGVVTDGGDVLVSEQNSSEDAVSLSGNVVALNTGDVVVGPEATADADVVVDIDDDAVASANCIGGDCTEIEIESESIDLELAPGTTEAQASQIGDNSADVDQSAVAESGDAVSGSQVTGIVGADVADVQVQNSDEDSFALSGDTDALNALFGGLGPVAVSPFGDAQASQNGDSDARADQDFEILTGDALTGSQVTGVIES